MGQKLKKTACLSIIFLSIISIALCSWLLSNDMERRTVTVGFFEYPPYSMTDPANGQPSGYYVDILNTIAKDQNLEIKYVNTRFSDYQNNISKGKAYIMGLPVIITGKRQRIYNFSWPCDENDTILVVKKDRHLKGLSDLKKCAIGTTEGALEDYCQKMLKAKRIKAYKAYISPVEQYAALTSDKVDVIFTDYSIALYFNKLHPGAFKFADIALFKQYEYAGFPIQKKHAWLLKRINNGLRKIMNSSEYSRIYRKYFPAKGDPICN